MIDPTDPADPIRRQYYPDPAEGLNAAGEQRDPLGESRVEVVPRLLHRYADRALLLVTDRCAAYCRFCFRRESVGRRGWVVSARELQRAAAYVASHPEIKEVILSGGDPLVLPRPRLTAILAAFRAPALPVAAEPGLALRVHTRVPVALPRRVSPELVMSLRAAKPLRMVLQVNHPRELARECLKAVRRFREEGIPVLSQGVLLRGVNDDPQTLAALWRGLGEAGIRPYYLFQPDLARGTAHFRVNLERALEVYRRAVELYLRPTQTERARGAPDGRAGRFAPEAEVPGFALDLPGGGGKVLLEQCAILREKGGFYRVTAPDGRSGLYPVEEEQ